MVPLSEAQLSPPAVLPLLTLDAREKRSLQDQLCDRLRTAILEGALRAAQKLPSTRELSQRLSVSRNTVLAAYEQLTSEGYLKGSHGSGTYVACELPEPFLKTETRRAPLPQQTKPATGEPYVPAKPFRPCLPSIAEFPMDTWERLRRTVLGQRGTRLLQYGAPAGDAHLRNEIAVYLREHRGVRCQADQIIVTAGAQQAFGLIARACARKARAIWCEDPGYLDARDAFMSAGLQVVPIPVDAQGAVVPGRVRGDLAYLTPSRQFPLCVTMSLDRRMEWLSFAERHQVWLIEDDYDSEFRYVGRPLPSLQGLVADARVIYVGTFSKALYPSLRVGYIVAPVALTQAILREKETADIHCPSIDQAVLAEFMRQGHFVRHLRKMRLIYAERAEFFTEATQNLWGRYMSFRKADAGLNTVGWLKAEKERHFSERAAAAGYQVLPLSRYAMKARLPAGLFFGFGAYPKGQSLRAIQELAEIWRPL
jgi:GntR family transcriptional regulator / MocR family aminotransferase